ncbi:MAG: ABC transporter substrate-binding protein [Ottowia sp.]|nr:ABC transporter substrate-binding protein [Ottowia sp.]
MVGWLNNLVRKSVYLGLISFSLGAAAQDQLTNDASTPGGLVRMVVNDVVTRVKADRDMRAGDIRKIQQLVEERILPHANFEKSTKMAMGRHWDSATDEQKAHIVQEFKKLLIYTYAGAIAQVGDQQIQFKPVRVAPEDTDAIVRTVVLNHNDAIQLDYRLEKIKDVWKVYDINVLGAWLIGVYRNQFNEQISKGGIGSLLTFLKERNQQLASRVK